MSERLQHFVLPRNPVPFLLARDDARGAEKRSLRNGPILVVEDDFLVALQIEEALLEAGLDLAGIARSAQEAIDLAVAHQPALVVMDVTLAGRRDGIDAALELFRDHGLRSIFASAHYDAVSQRRAGPARPLGWLQKPYSMTALIIMIRKALNDLAG